MWRVRWFLARLSSFVSPRRSDREMRHEMAAHLAMLEAEYRRRGLSEEAAKRAARRRFGGVDRMSDLHRDARVPLLLEQLRQDVHYTLRGLASNKVYSAIAVLTLGLGIGAATAAFSVVRPLLLDPLPFDEPGHLVLLMEQGSTSDWVGNDRRGYPLPPLRLAELAGAATTLDGILQAYSFDTTLLEPGEPSRIRISGISEGAFSLLRTRPVHGRLLAPSDRAAAAEPAAVASYEAWQRFFGGDRDALGRRLSLDLPSGRRTFRAPTSGCPEISADTARAPV